MATVANSDPSTIFHKEIAFSTTDEISGQNITEGYNVSGPFHNSITSITLAGGKKCVVPISSDNGEGAPYLKFHFPNGTTGNKMYLTFAVKNSGVSDGFYDYKTGIPSAYKNKLKQFIVSDLNLGLAQANGVKSKTLRFTSYGSSTNKPAEAITYYVVFRGLFDNGLTTVAANNQTFSTISNI